MQIHCREGKSLVHAKTSGSRLRTLQQLCRHSFLLLAGIFSFLAAVSRAQTGKPSTAWNQGNFHIERKGVVERSDIILEMPNEQPRQAMPMGNGRLGLAVWAQDGYTAQLNRGDTFPLRFSPGQVVVPGLKTLTQARDYSARLDLYDGEFQEHGGGMTATTYVTESLDVMVIDVTGADTKTPQTAELKLWSPRQPTVSVQGKVGILAETWLDNKEAGASGETFGSLAVIAVDALDVHIEKGPLSIRIAFRPRPDGSFRVLVGSPAWRGGDAVSAGSTLIAAAKALPAGASCVVEQILATRRLDEALVVRSCR